MKPDGGPAYPAHIPAHSVPWSDSQNASLINFPEVNSPGMSLRDAFAMNAPPYPFKMPMIDTGDVDFVAHVAAPIARWRYEFADAMLAERIKP